MTYEYHTAHNERLATEWPNPNHIDVQKAEMDARLSNPGWDEAAAAWDVTLSANPEERLAQLDELAGEHWNLRKGKERFDVNWDGAEDPLADPDSELGRKVFAAADKLRMVETTWAQPGYYQWGVILGGGMNSIKQRLEFQMAQPGVEVGRRVILASTRPISDAEKKAVANYAPNAQTEFDVAVAAVQSLLDVEGEHQDLENVGYEAADGETGRIQTFCTETENITVLCAPTPAVKHIDDQRTRANTSDTYWMLRAYAGKDLNNNSNVLVSTNAIYYDFQYTDACKEIADRTGAKITMSAFSAESVGVQRKPNQLVTEFRSSINSMRRRYASFKYRAKLISLAISENIDNDFMSLMEG